MYKKYIAINIYMKYEISITFYLIDHKYLNKIYNKIKVTSIILICSCIFILVE